MGQWNNRASYLESVDRTARSGCTAVGLDISENQLEYPFQALLRERNPQVRFVHTGVANASARYVGADTLHPCAVWCPDCIGNRAEDRPVSRDRPADRNRALPIVFEKLTPASYPSLYGARYL